MRLEAIYFSMLLGVISGCSTGPVAIETEVEPHTWIDNLPENQAGDIVRQSIDWAGGWENWMTKENLSYVKWIDYVDSNGVVSRSLRQDHNYLIRPELKFNISWEEEGDQYRIVYDGQQAAKFKNGTQMTDQSSINQAWNSSFGSHYVMCMPFKLADPGTELNYEGLVTLPDSSIVHSIKVTYQEGAGSAAGMHTWWYYFDTATYQPVANFLDYGQNYSYTSYESFIAVDGIKLNGARESFGSNAAQTLLRLSTRYRNSGIQFNGDLPESVFQFPAQ